MGSVPATAEKHAYVRTGAYRRGPAQPPCSLRGIVSSGRWSYPRGLIDPPAAVELAGGPLRLYERGVWVPGEQYWGEPEHTIPAALARVIAGGARREYEFEQLLPGGDNPDAEDPILQAGALRDRGQPGRAAALLRGLVEWDARCLDAHAHLGALAFQSDQVEAALAHYATGVAIAERSLPEDFDGVLDWGWIDTRRVRPAASVSLVPVLTTARSVPAGSADASALTMTRLRTGRPLLPAPGPT